MGGKSDDNPFSAPGNSEKVELEKRTYMLLNFKSLDLSPHSHHKTADCRLIIYRQSIPSFCCFNLWINDVSLLNQQSQPWACVITVMVSWLTRFTQTCQNNFSWDKDKQHYSWFHHSIYQARKQLWFIAIINRKKMH